MLVLVCYTKCLTLVISFPQHWKPGSAQFPGMCLKLNCSEHHHKGIRQWPEDQDMARRNGLSDWPKI